MWDLIVSVPDHCLSFYFVLKGRFQSVRRSRVFPHHCRHKKKRFEAFSPNFQQQNVFMQSNMFF